MGRERKKSRNSHEFRLFAIDTTRVPMDLPSATPANWRRCVVLSTWVVTGSRVGFGELDFPVGIGKPHQFGLEIAAGQSPVVVVGLKFSGAVADDQAQALGNRKILCQVL